MTLSDSPGADGYFGKATQKALKAFQKDNNLDDVGHAGNLTKAVLWYTYEDLLTSEGYFR